MFPKDKQLKDFRDHVNEFYGVNGFYKLGCGLKEIDEAIMKYAFKCLNGEANWGYGNSIDRVRVRTILEEMGFKEEV